MHARPLETTHHETTHHEMTRSVLAIAAAALALACCSAEPQLRARAYDLDAAMPPLADDVNADAQQGTGGGSSGTASAAQSESFTVSKGRDINAPMDNVILIGDQKPNGSAPSGDEKGDCEGPGQGHWPVQVLDFRVWLQR